MLMVMLYCHRVPDFLDCHNIPIKRTTLSGPISSSIVVIIKGIKLPYQIIIMRHDGPSAAICQLNQPLTICVKAAVVGHLHSLGGFEDLSAGEEPYPRGLF